MSREYYHKCVNLPSLFNNENLLEFNIEPDKRFLVLGESYLKFHVELPEYFVPSNNLANKLFQTLDLGINYENVNYKGSSNDYDITSFIGNRINYNAGYLEKIKFEGHFDNYNLDSSELKNHEKIIENRRGELFTKSIKKDGEIISKNYYRYMLIVPINHGICEKDQILPPGVHVRLSFHRAKAQKAVVDISDAVIEYPTTTIQILNPTLQVCWRYSAFLTNELEKFHSRGMEINFESSHVRHQVLDSGLAEHNVPIMQGKMPENLVCFLMEPYRFDNHFKYSSTKFEMHDLMEFSLLLDNDVCEHYPLKVVEYGGSKFYHEFYRRWLEMTLNYGNSKEEILTEPTFIQNNFMILENFQDFENKEGHLSLKLKFAAPLKEKLYICWVPTTVKTMTIDRNMSVSVK